MYGLSPSLTPYIPKCNSFILDSGAFTFMRHSDKHVNWEDYIRRYADFIIEHNIKNFVELDIDLIVGRKETDRLRDLLENLTGIRPIWVLQTGRSYDDYLSAVKEYPVVSIPLSGKVNTQNRDRRKLRWHIRKLYDDAAKHGCRLHGLGFTSSKIQNYAFDSVDSTAWVSGQSYGFVLEYKNGRLIEHKVPNFNGSYRLNYWKTVANNLNCWKMYSSYIKRKCNIDIYLAGVLGFWDSVEKELNHG